MKFAFVFPGQGSQSLNMMASYQNLPIIAETFTEASDTLMQDFWAMIHADSADEINQTINTQPLMLTAGIAVYRAWINLGGNPPDLLAGHSLGEYSALVAADALSFADALSLVRFRAQAMQQAVPDNVGGMAAILGLNDEKIKTICQQVTQQSDNLSLEPANYNSPGQVVIAGHKDAVLRGIELAKENGAKRAVMLPVSIPSHCTLMQPAVEEMRQQLEKVKLHTPKIPVLHNVDAQARNDGISIKDLLVQQLYRPVQWVNIIQALGQEGISHIAECGPGKVLTGLNKRIARDTQHLPLADSESMNHAINTLNA